MSAYPHTRAMSSSGSVTSLEDLERRGPSRISPLLTERPRGQKAGDADISRVPIDPFLAQYMKPITKNNHDVYFSAINKLQLIKSYDYYQKYLNVRKIDSRSSFGSKASSTEVEKQASPLVPTALEQRDPEASQKSPPQSRRRRQTSSEPSSQSLPKKIHPEVALKVLPLQFIECLSSDLIDIMTRMIHSLITLNDRSVPLAVADPTSTNTNEMSRIESKKLLTRYHSRTPPTLSISTYLNRLTKFNHFTQTTLLTTIYYIDLLSHNFQPYFTLNSWTVHRFLLVATMIAQKSLEDFFYTNDHYAKVGGVALTELNCLELDFLDRVDWKVVPAKQILPAQTSIKYSKEVLDLYYRQLVSLMGKNVTEQNNTIYTMSST